MKQITIKTPEEFDFQQCMVYLNRSNLEPLHVVDGGGLRKVVKINRRLILLEITNSNPGNLDVRFLNNRVSPADANAATFYIREWFDLDRDLSLFYRLAAGDALLSQLTGAYHGLRIVRIHDLFQALCWAVLGQQVNIRFAFTLYARLVKTYGENYLFEQNTYRLFPQPAVIAALSVQDLRKLQLTEKKSEYLLGVARAINAGEITRSELLQLNDFAEAGEELMKLRGIGPWTANYVRLRCLGDPDVFPIEDVGLHNAIKQLQHLTVKPTIDEVCELAQSWSGWRGYAAFFLYRSLL